MAEHQPKHKTVLFAEGHLMPTVRGEKKITIRLDNTDEHMLEEGEIFVGDFFVEGIKLALRATADTELTMFSTMLDEVAQEDGFADVTEAMEQIPRYYPDENIGIRSPLVVVRYEVPTIDDILTVQAARND